MDFTSLQRFIDKYIGALIIILIFIVSIPFSIFRKRISNVVKESKEVLVIRLWTLGESILTLPMVKKLHDEKYKVTILCRKRINYLFNRLDFVDEIVNLEDVFKVIKKFKKYDIVIDTEPYLTISSILSWYLGKVNVGYAGLFRSLIYKIKIEYGEKTHATINFTNMLKPLNIKFEPKMLVSIPYNKTEMQKVQKIIKNNKMQYSKIIGIHAGCAETAKWRSWKKSMKWPQKIASAQFGRP